MAELRTATDEDLAAVVALLDENELPSGDVQAHFHHFVVGQGEGIVGVGGMEVYGGIGLLRSICVAGPARGQGLGHRLCDEMEARAAALGIHDLYLLTTTARGFFEDRGFTLIDRADAPAAIRATAEFQSLCPSTAACLHKRLGPSLDGDDVTAEVGAHGD